jgi:hypothetical protein
MFSFRMSKELIKRIDRELKRRDPPIPRSQWMREAVVSKLERKK